MNFQRVKKLIIGIIAFTFPLLAYAQFDVEEAAREADRSLFEDIGDKLKPLPKELPKIQEEKKAEKKKGEAIKFFIKKINLVGCESFPPDEFKSIMERYENKEVSLPELNILAKEIERNYLKEGIIVDCFVPPQDIKEDVITLQVIEAKLGEIKIEDHKYFKKKRLEYYWGFKPSEVLRYDKLSYSLHLMNKNPDRNVKAQLRVGKEPETTDVYLDVKTYPPLHLIASFDREGAVSTGKIRQGYGIRHNNLLGLDDSLLTGYIFGSNYNSIYAYHTVPVSSFGTSLLYGYSYSKSFPKKELTYLGIDSRTQNTSVYVYQDILKKDNYSSIIHLGLDIKDKITKWIGGVYSRDRLRILRLGNSFIQKGSGSFTHIKSEISQGVNLFGARRKNFLSSRGAKSTFTKLNLKISHRRALPLNLQANVKFVGQLATTKLTPQEEYFLGGINSVRGYPSGDFLADDAVQVNLEILFPSFFIPRNLKLPYAEKSLRNSTDALVFFDYGWGNKRGSLNTERKRANFKSVGAGLRIQLFNQVSLRLGWGFPIGDDTIRETGRSRFYFSVDFEEQLPRERERIREIREKVKELKEENARISDI